MSPETAKEEHLMNDELLRQLETEVRKLNTLTREAMRCSDASARLGAGLLEAMLAIDRMQYLIDRHLYQWHIESPTRAGRPTETEEVARTNA